MAYCPSPGPPCYTMKGSFRWERKYFDNPIVSGVPIDAQILDLQGRLLVKFNPVVGSGNPVASGAYFYYEPDPVGLKKLKGENKVTFHFNEAGIQYAFEIEIY